METRPKIKLQLSVLDRYLEKASQLLLICTWGLVLYVFSRSADIIPTHYDAHGNINDYGSKWTMFIAPFIATALFFGLTRLNRYPHIFNYMVRITAENARRQYTLATRMMRCLKLSVIIVVFIVVLFTSRKGGAAQGPGLWFLPFIYILFLTPTVVLMVKSFKAK